ncbi:arylsulfatase B-like isoform X2 [Ptychodera flava]|uniref:arylsulfatase B-like isoform X2 n=1 Tax=Ptychodera flava TaxID=63121 RepID=UPI00396A2202
MSDPGIESNHIGNGCLREDPLKIEECDDTRVEVSYKPKERKAPCIAGEGDISKSRLVAGVTVFAVVILILFVALLLNVYAVKTECQSSSVTNSLLGDQSPPDRPPHIVFIMVDNLGTNDVGWNNPNIKTPILNSLAVDGVILSNFYSQPSATASRAAFLTGRYPFKLGYQRDYEDGVPREGLPRDNVILPRILKQMGYSTHVIGKWDLGWCDLEDTPLHRGFDSFYGYYMNNISPMNHSYRDPVTELEGINLFDNTGVVSYEKGTFLFDLFEKRLGNIIENISPQNPLFLMISIDSMLSSNDIPQRFQETYDGVEDRTQRTRYAAISALDELVGNLKSHLESSGLWEETVLVFASNNGVDVNLKDDESTSTVNINGEYLSERRTRVPAFSHGKMMNKTGYVNKELVHVIDWAPTLVSIAGRHSSNYTFDGLDLSETLIQGLSSPRHSFIYNILSQNPIVAAVRHGDYKLTENQASSPIVMEHLEDKGTNRTETDDADTTSQYTANQRTSLNTNAKYLYNIANDPLEESNLAESQPEKVNELHKRLMSSIEHIKDAIPLANDGDLRKSFKNGVWIPGRC